MTRKWAFVALAAVAVALAGGSASNGTYCGLPIADCGFKETVPPSGWAGTRFFASRSIRNPKSAILVPRSLFPPFLAIARHGHFTLGRIGKSSNL